MSVPLREQVDILTMENGTLRSALHSFVETIQEAFDELQETGLVDDEDDAEDEENAPAPKENGFLADAATYAGGRLNNRRARKVYERAAAAHAKTKARLEAAERALK